MSSYLAQMIGRRLTVRQFLAKSAGWLARKSGLDDAEVDRAVAQADRATDEAATVVAEAVADLIARAFPLIPATTAAVIAQRVAAGAMDELDTAIAAVGAFVKERN